MLEPTSSMPPSISFTAPGPSPMAGPSSSTFPNEPSFPQYSSYEWGGSSTSLSRNGTPAGTPSESGSSYSHAPSRSNSVSTRYHRQNVIDPTLNWSPEQQRSFGIRIARLTASAGFPLSWVDNTEWIDFCTEFLPAAKLPSRRVLTRRLLPEAVAGLRTSAKIATKGQNVTLQADGWTGLNNHHLLAFMITANGKVCTPSSHLWTF